MWILGGIILVIIGVWLLVKAFKCETIAGGIITLIVGLSTFTIGLMVSFAPLIEKEEEEKYKMMEICEQIGGEYQVIDRNFNGKTYVDVYGCVKSE